jgi:hypothetical protein
MRAVTGKQARSLLGFVVTGLAGLPIGACSHPQARPVPVPIPIASSSLASEVGQSGEKTEPTPVAEGQQLEPPVTPAEREELAEKAEAGKPVTAGAATPADVEMLSKPAATTEVIPGTTTEAAKPAAATEATKPEATKPEATKPEATEATKPETKPSATTEATKPETKPAATTEPAKPDMKPVATTEPAKPDTNETRGPLVTDTGAPAPTQPPPVASPPDRPASASLQLKPGAVKMIQQRLAIAGVLPEVQTSGLMDAPTRAALMRYQQANGLPATGEPDDATVRKLGLRSENIFEP